MAKPLFGFVCRLIVGRPTRSRCVQAAAFCMGCRDVDIGGHRTRYRSVPGDSVPSHLAIELRHRPWVPVVRDGETQSMPGEARTSWWGSESLGSSHRQSHERYLERTDPTLGVTEALSRLAEIPTLRTAPIDRLGALLTLLRQRLETGVERDDPDRSGLARQAFVGLHRRVYERLAELHDTQPEEVRAILDDVGVLCERGGRLDYVPRAQARHDDGAHAAHIRYFVDALPRVVLPRHATAIADTLGILGLRLTFDRLDGEEGQDVSAELQEILFDRIPEVLAILVHHSQGTSTLERTSVAFDQRARRLQSVQVRQLEDLVLAIGVEGTDLRKSLGQGSNDDTFLDAPTSASPVLYHDLRGPDWTDRLRRHLAPHVAALVENAAYEHTLEAFFNRDGDAEREHFLLTLGVRPEDVDHIAQRVGAVSRDAVERRRRWFAAIAVSLGGGGRGGGRRTWTGSEICWCSIAWRRGMHGGW